MEMGIKLPVNATEAFHTYYAYIVEKSEIMNLTAISGIKDVAQLHFLDSLALVLGADFRYAKVIDIGSGAGFPGLPLKIAVPSIELTLLDATAKRIKFLEGLCEKLDIEANCVHGRAEDISRHPESRESYDFAVSRAVAKLNILCELCLPFVKVGGHFLAMKGLDSAEEIEAATAAMESLGAKLDRQIDYEIPGTNITHRIVSIKKTDKTTENYPRRYAKISKAPL